jgi:hypothetical protein
VSVTKPLFRLLPKLDQENTFFWTSGKDGRLRFLRCESCSYHVHPPAPICPRCLSRSLAPHAVSGKATVFSYTVNHQPWDGTTEPYVIALVQIDEQDDVRLTTNVVDCAPGDVAVGMPVEVCFEDHDPVFIPLFRPVTR